MYRYLALSVMLIGVFWPLTCSALDLTDPFAYCAAIGTIDTPDARYTGPKTPDTVVQGLIKVMGMPADAVTKPFARQMTWRCMNGRVYACHFGANIPCLEKADAGQAPNPGMKEFCHANPASEMIPAYITGRATVYEWRCTNGTPTTVRQMNHPDESGFLSEFWYLVEATSKE